ncbi:MAG: hypothetical protein CVU80_02805, partial [Elusimicrobia bacterium HGW-Elusimicrobia-4]
TSTFTPEISLDENGKYYWKVYAYDMYGATTAVETGWYFWVNSENEAPSNFSLIYPGDGIDASTTTIEFTWGDSIDPDPNDTAAYELYYSIYSNYSSSQTFTGLSYSSKSVSGLADNTSYYWKVMAYDIGKASTTLSANTSWYFNVRIPPLEPTALTALDKANDSGGSIYLGWTKSDDDGAGWNDVQGYSIYRSTYQGGYGFIDSVLNNTTYYYDGTAVTETFYYYVVRATDSYNESVNSSSASAKAVDNIDPVAITNLTALAGPYGGVVTLQWTAPAEDNGGSGACTSYDVRYSTTGDINSGNFDAATQAAGEPSPGVVGASEEMYVLNLTANVTHWFAIKSIDESGNAVLDTTIWISSAIPPPPTAPASITVTDTPSDGGKQLNIEWPKSVDDGGGGDVVNLYQLYRSTTSGEFNYNVVNATITADTSATYFYTDTGT